MVQYNDMVEILFAPGAQYVVLGPCLKVINLNILPESSHNELKYSLKIAFTFLSIILKFQVPDIYIFCLELKKGDHFRWSLVRECGPRSASQASSTKKT